MYSFLVLCHNSPPWMKILIGSQCIFFDDTVGHSWQTCVIVVGVCPVFCFASLFSLDSETKIWPGDLRFGGPLQVSSDKLENLMEAALDELGKISQHGSYPAGHPLL